MTRILKSLLASIFFLGTSTAIAGSQRTTSEVWQHHIAAWEARDLTAIVSDYTSDSALIINGRLFKGRAEIEQVFSQLFAIFDNGINRIDPPMLVERIVYLTWHFTPSGDKEYYGTDTFIIEDGVIAVQTIASPLYDKFEIK
jgi:hypothetical protein